MMCREAGIIPSEGGNLVQTEKDFIFAISEKEEIMRSMHLIRYGLACVLAWACVGGVRAQDMHLSQSFSNPLYINPAFAGTSDCGRIGVAYRNQWPNIGGGFSLATVTYDQYIKALHGGIGAYVNADFQGGGTFRDITAAFMYAFRAQLGGKLFLTLAVEGSYSNRYVNWNSLTFPDQYDPFLGLVQGRPTQENLPNTPMSKHHADVAAGLMLYGEYFYVGFSASHLTRPDIGFMAKYRMDMKFSAQAGGMIYFRNSYGERHSERDFSLSPNIIYIQQGKFTELNYGLYGNFYPFVAGLWFRQSFSNPDAVIFLFGGEFKGIRLAYSYDLTVSKLTARSGGSHEISLGFRLPCAKQRSVRREIMPVPCPKF